MFRNNDMTLSAFRGLKRKRLSQAFLGTLLFLILQGDSPAFAQNSANDRWQAYFEHRVSEIEERAVNFDPSASEARHQLQEMLGLEPWPQKTPLNTQVTGTVERDGVIVEKLHFQSRPGLYVTANLYRPADIASPSPAILYLCGHGAVRENGVSYGNKVHYQHHGFWLARHGFICLIIDSLQLGEIEAIHHGTYQYNRWWWLTRGYTPAGVEAWNCIRALDYLETRPEVDATRMGCTGRSGGGAYSWWIAALDERIQCAAPVAGITDLRDHVVHGCVEGHCDCMFMVNTYRWDYSQVASLVAPRPLLIVNTDRDPIFPLGGVVRIREHVESVYQRIGTPANFGLVIGPGAHEDTQDIQVPTLRWFRTHLMGDTEPVSETAKARFTKEELRVFDQLPSDEINTRIDESFVLAAEKFSPQSADDMDRQIVNWKEQIEHSVLRPWQALTPDGRFAPLTTEDSSDTLKRRVATEHGLQIELFIDGSSAENPAGIRFVLMESADEWEEWKASHAPGQLLVGCLPRGCGESQWQGSSGSTTQFHRRLYLVGETLAGGQVWDVRQALQACRQEWFNDSENTVSPKIQLVSKGAIGWVNVLVAIQDPSVTSLELHQLPMDRDQMPPLLNMARFLTESDLLCLAAERGPLTVSGIGEEAIQSLEAWSRLRNWPAERIVVTEFNQAP